MPDHSAITEVRPADQIVERTVVTDDGRSVHVRRTQRCDEMLRGVHAARDLRPGKTMRHVGSVPLVLWHSWMIEAGIKPGQSDTMKKMNEVVRKKLHDIEYQKLLVRRM